MTILGFLLWFSLTLGYQDGNVSLLTKSYEYPPYFATIELHASNEWLDIYTTYRNEMSFSNPYFAPATDYFTVGAEATYKQISLKAEHQCIHPVISSIPHDRLSGGYNRISVTIRSKP